MQRQRTNENAAQGGSAPIDPERPSPVAFVYATPEVYEGAFTIVNKYRCPRKAVNTRQWDMGEKGNRYPHAKGR